MVRYLLFWTVGGIVCALVSVRSSGILADVSVVLRFVTVSAISLVAYGIICSPVFYKALKNKSYYEFAAKR